MRQKFLSHTFETANVWGTRRSLPADYLSYGDLTLTEKLGLPADSVRRDVVFNREEDRQHI